MLRFSLFSLLLTLSACTTKTTSPSVPLQDTSWQLSALSEPLNQKPRPYLILHSEGQRIRGSDGCNRFTGRYQLNQHQLKFSQLASTKMACLHQGQLAQQFLTAIAASHSFKQNGAELQLFDETNQKLATFRASSQP